MLRNRGVARHGRYLTSIAGVLRTSIPTAPQNAHGRWLQFYDDDGALLIGGSGTIVPPKYSEI